MRGTIHWYDHKSAEGLVKCDTGELYYVHGSAIPQKLLGSIVDGVSIEFKLISDINWAQVSKITRIVKE